MLIHRFNEKGLFVECDIRLNPRRFVVCYKDRSWLEQDHKKLYKKCNLSKGLPSREAFDKWVADIPPPKDVQAPAFENKTII